MAGRAGKSRLNPMYLLRRHAGTAFMLAAAGLAAGAGIRALAEPTLYSATAEGTAAATAPGLDWEGKAGEWRGLLADGGAQAILTNNLRHAVKLAATDGMQLDGERLAGELLLLKNGASFPASLLTGLPARLGPAITVRTADLARRLDAQSLAVIAADLDPPAGGVRGGWDFSFFQPALGGGPVLARPGPTDYYFTVFHHLHALLNGREAGSPEEARRSAVTEVASRLEREALFAGGGGFGPAARRELVREIASIPFLAANNLYGGGWGNGGGDLAANSDAGGGDAQLWAERWAGMSLTLRGGGAGAGLDGTAAAGLAFALYPLMSPRDTPVTRVQGLAAAVALAYCAAHEAAAARETAAASAASVAAAAREAAEAEPEFEAEPEPEPEMPSDPAEPPQPRTEPRTIVKEEIDEEAAGELRESIRAAEESLLTNKAELPAATRRFAAAREDVGRLGAEALAARARADRLRERYDEAARAEEESGGTLSAGTTRLLAERDALAKRLAALLTYCTEEHPFVVEVRRSIAAIDLLLDADAAGAAGGERAAEVRATRLANLYLEWETASAAADGLDERVRRLTAEAECWQTELTGLEGALLRAEAELAALRLRPVPTRRVEVRVAAPEAPAPAPTPAPAPRRTQAPRRIEPAARRVAADPAPPALGVNLPTYVPLRAAPPGMAALWAGLAGGILAAIATMIIRELRGKRFYRADEAQRLVGLPILAALPAYDAKSLRAAAKTVKGEVLAGKGGLTFAPPPVDFAEPPPAAKRGKIHPRRHRPHVAAWVAGALFMLLAGALYRSAPAGFFQPEQRELAIPAYVTPALAVPPEGGP